MRILEATDCYPPPLVGGRDLQVKLLAHELVRRGHDVNVVSLAGPGGPRVEMDGPIPVHRITGWSRVLGRFYVNPDKPFHPTMADPGAVRSLRTLLRRLRPQVVHVHSWMLYSFLLLLPSPETRLIVSLHEYGFVCPKNTFVHRDGVCTGPGFTKCVVCASEQYGPVKSMALTTGMTLMRPWRGKVDRYVANSYATARASAALQGRNGGPIQVIPPFVPDRAVEPWSGPRPKFVPPDGEYLMFAGGLGPHKGLDTLLDAWSRLERRIPLVLAGVRRPDTPQSFPDGVFMAEEVPHDLVLQAWRHCAVAVVPSRWPEPFGVVALEAMAAGIPVVATSVGGLVDLVVDGRTGFLTPPGDAGRLRARIDQLLADPGLRAALGGAGRERAKKYTASAIVPLWETVFQEVLGAHPTVCPPGTQ